MLKKIKNKGSGVLVKFPKKKQDFVLIFLQLVLIHLNNVKKLDLKE